MSTATKKFAPGRGFPYPDGLIGAASGQECAPPTESHAGHTVSVPNECAKYLAGCCIPHFYTVVRAGRGQQPIVRAKRHRRYCPGVSAQSGLLAMIEAPQVVPFETAQVFLIGALRD